MSSPVTIPRIQIAVLTKPQQWRPAPFEHMPGELDRSLLDLALKTIYDHSYTLQQTSVQGVSQGVRVASGALRVKGSVKAVASGLSTLSNIVVSIDSGLAPTNLWTVAQPSASLAGGFDVAVFQPTSGTNNAPILATSTVIVRWIAYGT